MTSGSHSSDGVRCVADDMDEAIGGVGRVLWGAVFRLVLIRHVLHEAGSVKPPKANHDAFVHHKLVPEFSLGSPPPTVSMETSRGKKEKKDFFSVLISLAGESSHS